ncbi:hypothetical protein PVK06_009705 [Gossypium arboreum]|uniref:Uncharacterized protein n=1 Tax=Gossypium arboreum TaxID=29729 RepID=A0ABR0QP50_GOSAR|nr:hypothetical protein PVK06_009705 [Gossypium arboreum]
MREGVLFADMARDLVLVRFTRDPSCDLVCARLIQALLCELSLQTSSIPARSSTDCAFCRSILWVSLLSSQVVMDR